MLNYDTEVHIVYGSLSPMIDWCKRNCSDPWEFSVLEDAGNDEGKYKFCFDSERDYINFLIWRK